MTTDPISADPKEMSVTDDFDADGELGFAPAVSATGAEPIESAAGGRSTTTARSGQPRWRRRMAGVLVLFAALMSMGGAYALFATTSGAAQSTSAADVQAGRQIYDVTCITCHGANLDGVTGRGPSLVGVGAAAVYFQVSTGRMPLVAQGPEATRKPVIYSDEQISQLSALVDSYGGGPAVPNGNLRDGNLAEGGELFRLNCASCHGSTGRGAPLSAGKAAPGLSVATDKQIYTAMLSGPENMPVFSDNQLTPEQKNSIINYVQTLKAAKDPGGSGIGRIGPVSEGLIIWVVGIGLVMGAILWIGAKG